MGNLRLDSSGSRKEKVLWWLLLLVCLVYAGFAIEMFLVELNKISYGVIASEAKLRRAPTAFMLHALFGGFGLVAGVMQLNSRLRLRSIRVHRAIGWIYLVSIWGASTSGIINAFYFDVPLLARIIFIVVGVWWFFSTSLAYWYIRQGAVNFHKCWMIRSYAISLFFITFPIWVPTMQLIASDSIAWPTGLLFAISMNVIVSELWIRKLLEAA